MKKEELDIVIKEWMKVDPESKYILVYYDDYTLTKILKHKVPEGIEVFIYMQ